MTVLALVCNKYANMLALICNRPATVCRCEAGPWTYQESTSSSSHSACLSGRTSSGVRLLFGHEALLSNILHMWLSESSGSTYSNIGSICSIYYILYIRGVTYYILHMNYILY
jgi:hypothetical protein